MVWQDEFVQRATSVKELRSAIRNKDTNATPIHCVSGVVAQANKPYVWIKCSELIPSDLSRCHPNRLQENPMIYRRTSIISYRFGFMNIQKWFWAWVVVLFSPSFSPSSSSFPPLYSILFHNDPFLFYWCWCRTSTMRSRWFAMKIPWAIAPKVHKSGSIFLYIQKRLKEYYTDQKMF